MGSLTKLAEELLMTRDLMPADPETIVPVRGGLRLPASVTAAPLADQPSSTLPGIPRT